MKSAKEQRSKKAESEQSTMSAGNAHHSHKTGAAEKAKSTTRRMHPDASVKQYSAIQEAAYYLAEKRGFEPGHDMDDWLAAESNMDVGM